MNSEPEHESNSPTDDKQPEMNTIEPHEDANTEVATSTPGEVKPTVEAGQTSQPTPPASAPEAPQIHKTQADAVTLVLQWLAYAFWGWFALAMLW